MSERAPDGLTHVELIWPVYTRAARQKVLAASAMPLLISGQTANK
jgi:hypothetical protein